MLPRARFAWVRVRSSAGAGLTLLALGLLSGPLGGDALAGSKKNSYGNSYGSGYGSGQSSKYYDYQRETARQQAEMERQQREQQRAAEQAQREAQKQAQRLQAEFEAQQRRDQERALRDAERQRQQTMREMEAARRQAEKDAERQRQQAQRDMDAAQRRAQQEAEQEAKRSAAAAQRAAEQASRDAQQAATREAQRASEAAAREAQRAAQQTAARAAQQQDTKWKQNGWGNDRQQEQAKPAPAPSAPVAAPRVSTPQVAAPQVPRADKPDDTDDVADVDLDQELQRGFAEDEANPNLTAADRRVRELERLRRVEERRQARAVLAQKRRDAQRSERSMASDRDRGRDRGKPMDGDNAAKPRPDKWAPRDDKSNDEADTGQSGAPPTDVAQDGDTSGDDAPGNDKMLSGWQQQAMRLGGSRDDPDKGRGSVAGRGDDGRDDQDRRGRRPDKDNAKSDQDGKKAGKPEKDDAKDKEQASSGKGGKDKSDTGRKSSRAVEPPPPGAELPPEQFEEERAQELIVPELSPEEVKTAEENGFVVDTPTELGNSGSKVVRVRLRDGGNRADAERTLHRALPFAAATPNYAYKIFQGQEGQSAALGAGGRTSPASAEPCPDAVCFGRKLISWTPKNTLCVKDVRVGVIDTSFDTTHPAFRKIKKKSEIFPVGSVASPYDWHGTAVLSLLAGDPASGTPGLVPDATFLLAAAFRSDVNGNASTDTVRLLAALAWLEEQDVDVVNMSFSGPEDPSLARAIERMSKKGIVFIAAAGNMGPTASPSYPAAYPNVIAVTAVSREGLNYKNANRGAYIDISAPGVDILAALPHARQGLRTGTSFAAPFVTAVVAASGADIAQGVSTAKLVTRLPFHDIGPPGQDPIYGVGLVSAPLRCGGAGRGEVAVAEPQPAHDPWATQTTTFSGASVAP